MITCPKSKKTTRVVQQGLGPQRGPGVHVLYTAISRKVVGKKVHATILKGSMGCDQYTVSDTVAVKPPLAASL